MTRIIPLLLSLSLLAGCAVSSDPPSDPTANCADFASMSHGLVSCEVGDHCAYQAVDRDWSCGCAEASHVFFCEAKP
jgi:hypothetical protein